MSQKVEQIRRKCSNVSIPVNSILIFMLASLVSAVVFELLKRPEYTFWNKNIEKNVTPTYAIYGKSKTEEHLRHITNVLNSFGYQRTSIDNDWNLLWAHDYPFNRIPRLKNLQSHQLVNHFPGCGFITNKVDLSTTPFSFLPRAFRLPAQYDEFMKFSHDHPKSLFVEKHNEHRNIQIVTPSDVNLRSNSTFIQEFIQNPFLVDGYKFDIGVYVVITSVSPLRVYIYSGDVLFRYCAEKYYPFDSRIVDKYVVGDNYLPTWQVPSLMKYYNRFGGSMRATFEAYVQEKGMDPSGIWTQVEQIIRSTILSKEVDITRILRSYKTKNFFDLIRFDLIIDDKLRVYLMEANMSPNLSSAHFKPNSLLYEQLLYSAFNLVGIGSPFKQNGYTGEDEMITADKNLATNLNLCAEFDCENSCNMEECRLCLPCLSGTEYEQIRKAHREHLHRMDMKRIFPKPILNLQNYVIEEEVKNMTKSNELMTRWFFGKCIYDHSWCA